jgi:uncharacterized membrane protein YoaT (DUF817 family)
MRTFIRELWLFGLKQAASCVFAAFFMAVLLLSRHASVPGIARYDLICLAAVVLQIVLLATRIESPGEACVLALFHAVGLGLELYKTQPHIASWSYPETGLLKVGNVPLYSGFMYAAVASYMCQSWRWLKLELRNYPGPAVTAPLGLAIYANFFTNEIMPDVRWALIPLVFLAFRRTWVDFTPAKTKRTMPLALSFLLIGFFVWVAENYSTLVGAWVYPHQRGAWRAVSLHILTSWFLLVIVSFILVAALKHAKRTLGEGILTLPDAQPSSSFSILPKSCIPKYEARNRLPT